MPETFKFYRIPGQVTAWQTSRSSWFLRRIYAFSGLH